MRIHIALASIAVVLAGCHTTGDQTVSPVPTINEPPGTPSVSRETIRSLEVEARLKEIADHPTRLPTATATYEVIGGRYHGCTISVLFVPFRPVRVRSWTIYAPNRGSHVGGGHATDLDLTPEQLTTLLYPDKPKSMPSRVTFTVRETNAFRETHGRDWYITRILSAVSGTPRRGNEQ